MLADFFCFSHVPILPYFLLLFFFFFFFLHSALFSIRYRKEDKEGGGGSLNSQRQSYAIEYNSVVLIHIILEEFLSMTT